MITVTDGKIMNVTSPFGGLVSIVATGKNSSTDKQAFYLELSRIPEEACIELLSHDWMELGKTVIRVEGTTGCGHWTCGGTEIKKYFIPPISVDDAVEVCKEIPIYFYIDVDPNSEYWQSKINPS